MAIEEDDESDNEQEEEDNKSSHYAFMFHPGPPTKIAEMVQSVGSWKPNTIKIESSLFSSSFRNPFLLIQQCELEDAKEMRKKILGT
ncbi:hypothetical protein Tco_0630908 [Tanacetum coccineum]